MSGRWRILGLLMLFAVLCHFNRIGMSVAGTGAIMKERGLSPEQMGMVYSAYLLIYTLLMTPGGWFIDRHGPKSAMAAMGFTAAGGAALTGVVGWVALPAAFFLPALIVVRGLTGAANVPMHPGAARSAAAWFPPGERGLANGLITGAALVGITFTYYGFGFLMKQFAWPAACLIGGGATALAAALWQLTPREPAGAEAKRAPAVRFPVSRSLWLLTVSYAAIGYFQYLFFYWMEYYFKDILRLDADASRLYSTIVTGSMAVGIVAGGWITDRVSRRGGPRAIVPVVGMLASAVLLVFGILSRNPAWVVPCFSLALAAVGICESPFWVAATALGGRSGGFAAAVMNTGGNAGGMLAPYVTPLFSKHFGWQGGLVLAGVFAVAGAVLWRWIDPDESAE